MKKNNNNKDAIKLWGHDFNRAKSGLDEEQIVSFVNGLISERDTLTKRQEHLSSLVQLAERTVAEADNIAKQVKEEAFEQSKVEAETITAQAEEQAQQMIEEKRAESLAIAEKEAKTIKNNAEHEAKLLLEEKVTGIQSELKGIAQQLYAELLSQLESLKQQVTASEADFEQMLSQRVKQAEAVAMVEDDNIMPDIDSGVSLEVIPSIPAEAPEQIQAMDQTDTSELEIGAPISTENQETIDYKKEEVELEILPPVDISKVMGIMTYLDSLPEVENTELIPLTDKPLIEVLLREPIDLIDALRTLPEVERIEEIIDGEFIVTTGASHAKGKRRKIQITLSGKNVLDETKERLNNRVPHILSS